MRWLQDRLRDTDADDDDADDDEADDAGISPTAAANPAAVPSGAMGKVHASMHACVQTSGRKTSGERVQQGGWGGRAPRRL